MRPQFGGQTSGATQPVTHFRTIDRHLPIKLLRPKRCLNGTTEQTFEFRLRSEFADRSAASVALCEYQRTSAAHRRAGAAGDQSLRCGPERSPATKSTRAARPCATHRDL